MRCVIVSGAEIKNFTKIKTFLSDDDFYIFCDGGLNHCQNLGISPNLIIGDFDSYSSKQSSLQFPDVETIRLPPEKDDTDTFFAVKEGVRRGFSDFLILGAIGNRFDHSLCNVSALLYLDSLGLSAKIIDDYSEMEILSGNCPSSDSDLSTNCSDTLPSATPSNNQPKHSRAFIDDSYSYFSLMLPAGDVEGVTIKNAKYPLENASIKANYQFGISNEVLKGKKASVSIKKGRLLLIKVW